jgi:hypothetical protein
MSNCLHFAGGKYDILSGAYRGCGLQDDVRRLCVGRTAACVLTSPAYPLPPPPATSYRRP